MFWEFGFKECIIKKDVRDGSFYRAKKKKTKKKRGEGESRREKELSNEQPSQTKSKKCCVVLLTS